MYAGDMLSLSPEEKNGYFKHLKIEFVKSYEIKTKKDLLKHFPEEFKDE